MISIVFRVFWDTLYWIHCIKELASNQYIPSIFSLKPRLRYIAPSVRKSQASTFSYKLFMYCVTAVTPIVQVNSLLYYAGRNFKLIVLLLVQVCLICWNLENSHKWKYLRLFFARKTASRSRSLTQRRTKKQLQACEFISINSESCNNSIHLTTRSKTTTI